MRRVLLTLFAVLGPFGWSHSLFAAEARRVVSLDGEWQVTEGAMDRRPETFLHVVRVPGVLASAKPPIASVQPRQGEGMYGKKASERPKDRNAFWYRRTITLAGALPEVAWLRVNKARFGVRAWVNGHEVGEHLRVRTAGVFDVRAHLLGEGAENEIVLRIGATQSEVPPDIPAFTAWTGNMPGLYDSVSLGFSGSPQVVRMQAVPDVAAKAVTLAVTLRNGGGSVRSAHLAARIIEDTGGRVVGTATVRDVRIAAGGEATVDLTAGISGCTLWSPETPFLYRFEVEVRDAATNWATDLASDRFGMRSFRISSETGRGLLNGQPVLLRGAGVLNVTDLFEHPACGDKPWRESWVRQALRNLKEVNCNAARFAFEHPPEIWYRLADEVGVLIQDEAHSGLGEHVTIEALVAEYTDRIHERANHPSVVIWDASNETSVTESKGRLRGAIARVRHLDRSLRPWDNGWDPTGHPGDITFELHPYLGWNPNYNQAMFAVRAAKNDWPGESQDVQVSLLKPGFIINEFCGVMLAPDGAPSKLAEKFFAAFMPPGATAADRFLARGRFIAMETEYWRRRPGILGILWNPYLHGSGRQLATDLEGPALDPVFARFIRDACAPVSVMVDHWPTQLAAGGSTEVPVSVSNDGSAAWAGEVRLFLLRAGRNLARTSAFFEPPAHDAALQAQTLLHRQQPVGTVPVAQQRSVSFTVALPAEPGHFQLMAEITGVDGRPVRSWRDFKTTP